MRRPTADTTMMWQKRGSLLVPVSLPSIAARRRVTPAFPITVTGNPRQPGRHPPEPRLCGMDLRRNYDMQDLAADLRLLAWMIAAANIGLHLIFLGIVFGPWPLLRDIVGQALHLL